MGRIEIMAGFAAKLHLSFSQWPNADKRLWERAFGGDDPFTAAEGARLSPASRTRYFMGWRRFLGFLAITDPDALELPPADRLSAGRVKSFAKHLAETCAPASVATGVEAAYHAARIMMPEVDFSWLKALKTRLHAAVPPKAEKRAVITSSHLLKLGQQLMDEVRPNIGPEMRRVDAVQFRDGLMFLLTAFAPIRPRNVAALDLVQHVRLTSSPGTILIPGEETKTGTPLEFEVHEFLVPYLRDYLDFVRPGFKPKKGCAALWLGRDGGPLSRAAFGQIFARHSGRRLGVHLSPHDVRAAAATTWAVFAPEQIGVAQELLTHWDARTTTGHYNRARGIQASRAYSRVLEKIRRF
jgi:integrase